MMNFKCSVFIATSLDGFIARNDGSIDWLEKANLRIPPGEDCGYEAFMSQVDVLIMGSGTFKKTLSFPEWPYKDKPVWIVSQSLKSLPNHLPPSVKRVNLTPAEIVTTAQQAGYQRAYIDGGKLIQSFLNEGLITDMTITLIPLLLGEGRPLFTELKREMEWELISSRAFPFGFVQSHYKFISHSD